MDPAAAAFSEMDELVEEVLIRCPPHDPALLARAALVCKRWCRILTGAGFRRRFRERHRAVPAMLGFLYRPLPVPHYQGANCGFTRTTSFHPRDADLVLGGDRQPLDCRHGRVLIGHTPMVGDKTNCCLAVWDPVTGEKLELPEPPLCRKWPLLNWNAAVLCASSRDGSCDHLDCHRGPFLVVVVGTNVMLLFAYVYSSEDGAWSKPTYALHAMGAIVCFMLSEPSVLASNALCFIYNSDTDLSSMIIKYDLGSSKIDQIQLPPSTSRSTKSVMLTAAENGGLGCAIVEHSRLSLWSRVAGPKGQWVWMQSRVIELEKIIPDDDILISYRLVGFARGLDVLFTMRFDDGLFTIDLKSGRMKKLCKAGGIYSILPYMSFCTTALRMISTGEGPSAGASSARRTSVSDARTESVSAGEGPSAGASSA